MALRFCCAAACACGHTITLFERDTDLHQRENNTTACQARGPSQANVTLEFAISGTTSWPFLTQHHEHFLTAQVPDFFLLVLSVSRCACSGVTEVLSNFDGPSMTDNRGQMYTSAPKPTNIIGRIGGTFHRQSLPRLYDALRKSPVFVRVR